tara:strand:+ start:20586 stop:21122 length:537 start_codon:yes stop_codon:yes gene_type:complete
MKTLLSLTTLLVSLITLPALAASKEEINAYTDQALTEFRQHSPAGHKLAARARGILVFPKVYKAGFGIGGEYGEGVLRIGGASVAYYSTAAASIGLQVGAQRKAQIILFMTDEALNKFRNSKGWEAGVDGSVAIASLGAGEAIDTNTARQPIIGFIFSNEGLMFNLNLEGSKFTKIDR